MSEKRQKSRESTGGGGREVPTHATRQSHSDATSSGASVPALHINTLEGRGVEAKDTDPGLQTLGSDTGSLWASGQPQPLRQPPFLIVQKAEA